MPYVVVIFTYFNRYHMEPTCLCWVSFHSLSRNPDGTAKPQMGTLWYYRIMEYVRGTCQGGVPNYLGSRPPSVAWLVGKYSSSKCCRKLQLTQAADTPRFMGSAFKLSFARSMDGTFLWARSSSTEASCKFSTLTARWPALTSRFLAPIFPGIFRGMTSFPGASIGTSTVMCLG